MEKKKEFLTMMIFLLLAAGIFFRDVKAVFAGFSITVLLLTDLFVLHKKTEKTASLFQCSRMADKTIIVRGKNIGIRTESDVEISPGTEVQIEDLIPKGSVVTSGTAISTILKTSGKYTGNYDILCLAHGINRFEGIGLKISDTFFSEYLILRKNSLQKPEIMVFPKPSFVTGRANPFSGQNTEKPTIAKGDQVKGIREYIINDDLRKIDWKASAKYDRLYTKEYSGIERDMQMLFIDLPDREDPASNEKLELIKGVAASILMNEDKNRPANIIEISGPNIIAVIKSEKLHSEAFDLINRIKPATRDKYLYKYSPKSYRYEKRGKSYFINVLSEKAGRFFSLQSPHVFVKQAYNVLGTISAGKEIFIITLPDGDMSHLKIIAQLARLRELKSVCFIPRDENMKSIRSRIYSCGFDEVNLI